MEPTSTKPSQLSCTNCRHRKVKCDKTSPCSACRRSHIECVFPTRPFKPRGRQGGSRARNVEITKRLNRLEGLMSRLGGEGAANALLYQAEKHDEPSLSDRPQRIRQGSNDSPNIQEDDLRLKPDGNPSNDFWSSLSGEVSLPGMLLLWESFLVLRPASVRPMAVRYLVCLGTSPSIFFKPSSSSNHFLQSLSRNDHTRLTTLAMVLVPRMDCLDSSASRLLRYEVERTRR